MVFTSAYHIWPRGEELSRHFGVGPQTAAGLAAQWLQTCYDEGIVSHRPSPTKPDMTPDASGKSDLPIPAPATPASTVDATRPGALARTPEEPVIDLSGQVVADFRLLRRLGEGGMGQVYLGEQLSLKRRVAVKLLRANLANNEVSRKRFKTEAEAVARLTHANIVQVYAVGEQDGHHFMALEYVEGMNLRDYLDRKGPPEVPIALAIMRQIAAALARAAELGIIHRDIKPENILLTRKVEVKVADFGLSRIVADGQPAQNLTQSGITMGTPLYMSPEQVQGKPLDCRTDIYSFGVTCYHMLAGEPPFVADNSFAVAVQHVQNEPVPLTSLRPDLPPDLCAMVHKMMAKKPDERYAHARDILKDLKTLSDQLKSGTLAEGLRSGPGVSLPLGASESFLRRHRTAFLVAASLVFVAGIGAVVGHTMRSNDDAAQRNQLLAAVEEKKEPPPLSPDQEREADLLKRIDHTKNPKGKDADAQQALVWDGVRDRIDLAYFYLYERKPHDLDSAEKLFAPLQKSTIKEYKQLGTVGMAVVLAFRDKSEESVNLFMSERWAGLVPEMRLQLGDAHFRQWLKMIRDGLNHDHRNYDQQKRPFPPPLAAVEMMDPGGRPLKDRLGNTKPAEGRPSPP